MTVAPQPRNRYLDRPSPSSLADVIDTILDKGLVIDIYLRVSLAVSSDRCESSSCLLTCPSLHGLVRCLVGEAKTGTIIELRSDVIEVVGGPCVEVGPLRKVL